MNSSPCKGKNFVLSRYLKTFALTGRHSCLYVNPGRCPGLGASALYLSLRPVTVGSGRITAFCVFKLPFSAESLPKLRC